MDIFFIYLFWLATGAATAFFANQRGRDPFIWFLIGMLLGVFGLLLVFLLPSLESQDQEHEELEDPLIETSHEPSLLTHAHDYLIKDWFYLDSLRQQQGPIRFEDLKTVWGEGSLSDQSYVWCEGMEQWKKIKEMPELREALVSL